MLQLTLVKTCHKICGSSRPKMVPSQQNSPKHFPNRFHASNKFFYSFLCIPRFFSFTLSFRLFSTCCLLFLAFFVTMLFIYKESKNKCALRQRFFAIQVCCIFLFSRFFNSLNRKEHTRKYKTMSAYRLFSYSE